METPFLYLLLNFFTVSLPLMRSFEPKVAFYKKFKPLFAAIAVTGSLFIAWDVIFTDMGVWSFNPKYLSGISFLGLPVEEWLFFITIPYACLFVYEVLNYFWPGPSVFDRAASNITLLLISAGIAMMIFYYNLLYTFWTFTFLTAFLLYIHFIHKPDWTGKFYRSFTVVLIGFFMVNGVLTGTGIEEEVVRYNPNEFVGLRIGTIPAEDLFYGLLLLMMNVWLFEYFKNKVSPESDPHKKPDRANKPDRV